MLADLELQQLRAATRSRTRLPHQGGRAVPHAHEDTGPVQSGEVLVGTSWPVAAKATGHARAPGLRTTGMRR
jgi:hypothetical protein